MKIYLTFTLLMLSRLTFAQYISTSWCYPKKDQLFEEFVENELRISYKALYKKGFLKKLYKWNSNVIENKMIKKGARVYIEVPYDSVSPISLLNCKKMNSVEANFYTVLKVKGNKKRISKKVKRNRTISSIPKSKINKEFKETDQETKESRLSIFYTFSKGSFRERSGGVTLNTNQDSPFTIGFKGEFSISKNFNLNSEFYLSQVDGSTTSQNEIIKVPIEYGANIFLDYKKYSASPLLGLEYESFSTFNTDELLLNEKLSTRQHKITYISFGFKKKFNIISRELVLKLIYGQSIASKSSRPSIVDSSNFNGSKILIFLETPLNEKWKTNFLIQRKEMEGATKLDITKLGIGLSYDF